MAEIGSRERVPDGKHGNLLPRDVLQQKDSKGGVFISLVEAVIGDNEAAGNVIEIGSVGAPPVDVRPR